MKKVISFCLALMVLFSIALAEDVSTVRSEDCYYYDSYVGVAILSLPESISESEYYFICNGLAVDYDLGAVAFYDALYFFKPDADPDNLSLDDLEAAVITSIGVMGTTGDITEESARKLLSDNYGEEIGELTEIVRADGHNAFVLPTSTLLYGESISDENQAILDSLQATHAELYANFVNIPLAEYAEKGDTLSFSCTDFDGNTFSSEELFAQADLTMLNIWTTWCGYCVNEMPELQKLNDETEGVQVVLVCFDVNSLDSETLAEAKNILAEKGVTLTCLIGTQEIMGLISVQAYPTSYLVNQNGSIISDAYEGSANLETYQGWIESNR